MALTNVATLIHEGLNPFEFGAACEAFALDRRDDGIPLLDHAVCAPEPGLVRTSLGFSIEATHGLDRIEEADLLVIPALGHAVFGRGRTPPAAIEAIRAAYDRGTRIITYCSGAFTLGDAGILDGIECTTHWKYTSELQRRFPAARVVPEVLYVDAGQIVTSAGTAAGLDASLHIWRQEYGAGVASMIARRMVVPPHRDGGQAQYIARAVPECDAETLGPLLTWLLENLGEEHTVDALARRAHMSPRTFARRFRDETGTTPHSWITRQRIAAAEELLERTEQPVEWIAAQVGFGNAAALRHHFTRVRGVSPMAYRRQFAC